MWNSLFSRLTTAAITLAAVASLAASPALANPEVGKPAPDFSAKDIAGKDVSVKALADKIVVLEWSNHECPFVKKFYEAGKMQELQKTYTAKNVVWVKIISSAPGKQGHVSAKDAAEIAAKQNSVASHIVLDETGAIGKAYGAKTTPHMFVLNKGSVAYMGAIDDKSSAKSTDIAGAKNYVAAALDALLAGKPVETASTQPYGCSVKY